MSCLQSTEPSLQGAVGEQLSDGITVLLSTGARACGNNLFDLLGFRNGASADLFDDQRAKCEVDCHVPHSSHAVIAISDFLDISIYIDWT
jgi:hypothetical protein